MKKYFGTDGIRGIPGESLKEEIVTKIFCSVEKILAPKTVAIILDTRESCKMITEWIVKGFSEEVSITNYGILPSGSMPILLETFNEDLGIIISLFFLSYESVLLGNEKFKFASFFNFIF